MTIQEEQAAAAHSYRSSTCARKSRAHVYDHLASRSERSRRSSSCQTFSASRRCRRFAWRSAAVAALALLQITAVSSFEVGEPIDVVVTSGDSIEIFFTGTSAGAIAFSFQQCSGSEEVDITVNYNATEIFGGTLYSNECDLIVADNTEDEATDFDSLCAFQSMVVLEQGYDENSYTVNNSLSVSPEDLTVEVYNPGNITASLQLVMFTSDVPSPTDDATVDNVNSEVDQNENVYTVESSFRASGSGDETYCTDDEGCAIYAYYAEEDSDEEQDAVFGTTCQARLGTLAYEGSTSTAYSEVAVQAIAVYTSSVCIEFPAGIAGNYRVYIIVSPDTRSYARVGYGLDDQLIYASEDVISVDASANQVCPEDDDDTNESSAGKRIVVNPVGAMTSLAALGLASSAVRGQ